MTTETRSHYRTRSYKRESLQSLIRKLLRKAPHGLTTGEVAAELAGDPRATATKIGNALSTQMSDVRRDRVGIWTLVK